MSGDCQSVGICSFPEVFSEVCKCANLVCLRRGVHLMSVSQMWAKLQTSERPHPQLPVMHFQEGLES